jgi:hypothetical protein
MTSAAVTATHTSDHDRAHRAVGPVAVVSTLTAMTFSIVGANSTGEWIFEVVLQLAAAGVLFGVVVPRGLRHVSAGGRGIVTGALGLLLVAPAFWLGLPVQLGAAAFLLGYAGKRADTGAGKAIASLVIGLLVVVAYLAIYASDYVHVHG